MNLLVAIKSCQRDLSRGCHEQIRRTWGKDMFAPVLFFIGGSQFFDDLKSDEIFLIVPDDYNSLALKTHAILSWFLTTEFDHIFLADNDCCVFPDRLQRTRFETADYIGRFNGGYGNVSSRDLEIGTGKISVIKNFPQCRSWASGAGYFLSRKAATLVVNEANPGEYGYAEDVMVGQVLGGRPDIICKVDSTNCCKYYLNDGQSRGYDPQSNWMERTYAAR